MKFLTLASGLSLLLFFSGCGGSSQPKPRVEGSELQKKLMGKPRELHGSYAKLFMEPKKNELLNLMELGLDAHQLGNDREAVKAFDQVLDNLEAFLSDDEAAKRARSLWEAEGQKEFKGEPYERCMAYFYRGLHYLKSNDFENARAVFKSGLIQDMYVEEDKYRNDFALLLFLEGYSSFLNGDETLFEDRMKELKMVRPDFTYNNERFLILAETGRSPRKVADGLGHSELKFRRGKRFKDVKVQVSIDGGAYTPLYPMEDIFVQSTTRGNRAFDKILDGKAVFKKNATEIASTLTAVSSNAMVFAPLFSNVGNAQGIAGAIGAVGAISAVMALNATPHADIRFWNNLPDTIHVLPTNLSPGKHVLKFQYIDRDNNVIEGLSQQRTINISEEDHIFWTRSKNQLSYKQKKRREF